MKVDLNQTLKDYQGNDIQGDKEPVTLRDVILTAINYREQNAKQTAAESIKIYKLSIDLVDRDEIDLDIDNLKLIKDNLPKVYLPMVAGQVISILEK